jgi:hypothetical protein
LQAVKLLYNRSAHSYRGDKITIVCQMVRIVGMEIASQSVVLINPAVHGWG